MNKLPPEQRPKFFFPSDAASENCFTTGKKKKTSGKR